MGKIKLVHIELIYFPSQIKMAFRMIFTTLVGIYKGIP